MPELVDDASKRFCVLAAPANVHASRMSSVLRQSHRICQTPARRAAGVSVGRDQDVASAGRRLSRLLEIDACDLTPNRDGLLHLVLRSGSQELVTRVVHNRNGDDPRSGVLVGGQPGGVLGRCPRGAVILLALPASDRTLTLISRRRTEARLGKLRSADGHLIGAGSKQRLPIVKGHRHHQRHVLAREAVVRVELVPAVLGEHSVNGRVETCERFVDPRTAGSRPGAGRLGDLLDKGFVSRGATCRILLQPQREPRPNSVVHASHLLNGGIFNVARVGETRDDRADIELIPRRCLHELLRDPPVLLPVVAVQIHKHGTPRIVRSNRRLH